MTNSERSIEIPVGYSPTETSVRVDNKPEFQKSPEEIRQAIETAKKKLAHRAVRKFGDILEGKKLNNVASKEVRAHESDLRDALKTQGETIPSVSTNKFEPLSDQEILDSRGSWTEPNSEDK